MNCCARQLLARHFVCALGCAITLLFGVGALRAAEHHVSIEAGTFVPDQLAIELGDTVIWTAKEPDHTVVSEEGLFDSTTVWDTVPYLETFSYTYETPGEHYYYCTIHGGPGGSGMAGVVVVSEPGENQPPAAPLNLLPANGATNQPLTASLRASPFADADPLDFHAASQWLVRRTVDNQIVFDSGVDPLNRTNRSVPDGALAAGEAYTWQVRYQDGRGAWSELSMATTFTTLVPGSLANGTGLRVALHNSPGFTIPLATATNSQINFLWGNARPHRRITADAFGARWEGSLLPQFTEFYDLQLQFRGRVRIWVNDQLLIDEWTGCAFTQARRGSIALVGGQLAPIRVEYAADLAGAEMVLRWTSASQPIEVVPTARLFPLP